MLPVAGLLSFSPVASVDKTAAVPYTKGHREQTWTGSDWPTCQASEPKPWPPASLLRIPGRYINIVPKHLGEDRYHLHVGSAVKPPPPLCVAFCYQEMGKLSRGWPVLTSQICQRHPPTALCHHTSLLSFQSFPLTLCNNELHKHFDHSGGRCVFSPVSLSLSRSLRRASFIIQVQPLREGIPTAQHCPAPRSNTTELFLDSPLAWPLCAAWIDLLSVAQTSPTPRWSVL